MDGENMEDLIKIGWFVREIQIGELFYFNPGQLFQETSAGCPGQSWLEDNGRPSQDPEAIQCPSHREKHPGW